MGTETMVWLKGSGVGVIRAPMTNAPTSAYRRYLPSWATFTTPSLASEKITIGVSNVTPTQNRNDETKETYSSKLQLVWIWSPPKPARNRTAAGMTTKK